MSSGSGSPNNNNNHNNHHHDHHHPTSSHQTQNEHSRFGNMNHHQAQAPPPQQSLYPSPFSSRSQTNNTTWKHSVLANGQWLGSKVISLGSALVSRGSSQTSSSRNHHHPQHPSSSSSYNQSHRHVPLGHGDLHNDGRANWMADLRAVGNTSTTSQCQQQAVSEPCFGYQNEFSTPAAVSHSSYERGRSDPHHPSYSQHHYPSQLPTSSFGRPPSYSDDPKDHGYAIKPVPMPPSQSLPLAPRHKSKKKKEKKSRDFYHSSSDDDDHNGNRSENDPAMTSSLSKKSSKQPSSHTNMLWEEDEDEDIFTTTVSSVALSQVSSKVKKSKHKTSRKKSKERRSVRQGDLIDLEYEVVTPSPTCLMQDDLLSVTCETASTVHTPTSVTTGGATNMNTPVSDYNHGMPTPSTIQNGYETIN